MSILFAALIALIVCFVASLLAGLFDFSRPYAQVIGISVGILVFLSLYSVGF